ELRVMIGDAVTSTAQEMIPKLLAEGDPTTAEQLLELALFGVGEQAVADYVAFIGQGGVPAPTIARWQTSDHPRAQEVLSGLYRAKGDYAAAMKHAEAAKSEALIEAVLWAKGDWAALAERPVSGPKILEEIQVCARPMLYRLDGNMANREDA